MHAVLDGVAKTIRLPKERGEIWAFNIAERSGYKRLDPLDLENLECLNLLPTQVNSLLTDNNGNLYLFKQWYGKYPYDGVEIERLGYVCG